MGLKITVFVNMSHEASAKRPFIANKLNIKSVLTFFIAQPNGVATFDYDENTINLISEIINANEFKESNVYNFKNINDDFINNRNLDKIWLLCKYFLMIKGFKNRYDSINIDLKATEKSNLLNS